MKISGVCSSSWVLIILIHAISMTMISGAATLEAETEIRLCVREFIFWRQISLFKGFWSKIRPVVQSSEIGGSWKTEMISLFIASWQRVFQTVLLESFFGFVVLSLSCPLCLPCPCLKKKCKKIYLSCWNLTEY